MKKRVASQSELDLKAWVLEQLRRDGRIGSDTLVACEFAIPAVDLRADIALANGEFVGVEIKSPADSLKRLSNQIAAYRQIFDRTLLVCSSRHIIKVLGRFPDVELWEVTSDYQRVIHQRAALPTGDERRRNAKSRIVASKSQSLSPTVTVDVHEALLGSFEQKFRSSSERFWRKAQRSQITPGTVGLLSRFREERLRRQEFVRQNEQFWAGWSEQAALHLG